LIDRAPVGKNYGLELAIQYHNLLEDRK